MQTKAENLIAIMHHLRTVVSQMHPAGDLSLGEFFVLDVIMEAVKENKNLTPTKLNQLLGTKKPATSRLLTVLEKKELIQKVPDERDHRIMFLCLTQEGERILVGEKEKYQQMLKRLADRMGEQEIFQMEQSLKKISLILESDS